MAQKSRPDPANGTVVTSDEYEGLALSYVRDGVVGSPADTPVVYADSTGRRVKVVAGKMANVRGCQWWSDPTTDEIIDTLPANTSGNPRIDRLVLRLNRSTRQVRTQYLQGTPAVTPSAPALTQSTSTSSGNFDMPLARWTVANGYTTVAAADIVTEAWYPQGGGTILCTSTSRPFGVVLVKGLAIYETDSGLRQTWTGAAWQRSDWDTAWGLAGGRAETSTAPYVTGLVNASGESIGPNSGSFTFLAGRRYQLRTEMSFDTSVSDLTVELRIREDGISGTERQYLVPPRMLAGNPCMSMLEAYYEPGASNVTKTMYATSKVASGSGALNMRRRATPASNPIRFEVWDVGPAGRITVV